MKILFATFFQRTEVSDAIRFDASRKRLMHYLAAKNYKSLITKLQ